MFDPWAGKIPWRRERLPTPVFWPGEFHGIYSLWGCKEADMTDDFHFPICSSRGLAISAFSLSALSPPCKDMQDNFLEDEERA